MNDEDSNQRSGRNLWKKQSTRGTQFGYLHCDPYNLYAKQQQGKAIWKRQGVHRGRHPFN